MTGRILDTDVDVDVRSREAVEDEGRGMHASYLVHEIVVTRSPVMRSCRTCRFPSSLAFSVTAGRP